MKRSRFSEERIIGILKEQEAGGVTADVCRHSGISTATFVGRRPRLSRCTGRVLERPVEQPTGQNTARVDVEAHHFAVGSRQNILLLMHKDVDVFHKNAALGIPNPHRQTLVARFEIARKAPVIQATGLGFRGNEVDDGGGNPLGTVPLGRAGACTGDADINRDDARNRIFANLPAINQLLGFPIMDPEGGRLDVKRPTANDGAIYNKLRLERGFR